MGQPIPSIAHVGKGTGDYEGANRPRQPIVQGRVLTQCPHVPAG